MANTSLPIWQIHPDILAALRSCNRLVLVAPTGSGKTTQVPQMLLDAGLAGAGQRIVVLQPRRVAARTVAARVAWERHCALGGEVGYQIRFDDQTGLGTRICYVTEGVLLRWLQDDAQLGDIAVLLFDEFHERNLQSDVALALAKSLQASARPDLKLVVMSATLDAEPVARYLNECPILVSEGRSWPVETRYLKHYDERSLPDQAADAVEAIVNQGDPGDVLVFMPGMAEINATVRAIGAARLSEPVVVLPLHGDLQPDDQDRAFAPHPRRKIVVATNVAETSVTIDGIRHVVDSGQARVARYDAERGISTLNLEPISRASADQRLGRAGRTAPGICHRLWTESGHLNRPERNTPEIQRSDLAEVVLLLHSLGITRAAAFDWLDKPDPQAVERAEALLRTLGALPPEDAEAARPGQPSLTPLGRRMLRLPMHPRYSRMLLEAARYNCVPAAALCAALVSGRDLLLRIGRDDKQAAEAREVFESGAGTDFYTLMRAFQYARNQHFNLETCRRRGIHAQTARTVDQTFEQLLQIARRERLIPEEPAPGEESPAPAPEEAPSKSARKAAGDDPLLKCLLAGFADQLCLRRDTGTLECDMTEGRSGTLMRESVVQDSPLFVAASVREVSGREAGPRTLLGLATAVKREWLEELFGAQLSRRVEHLFDRGQKRVAAVKLVRFHDLVIHHEHQREADPEACGRCLAEAHAKGWFELPLLNHAVRQFIARVNLVCAAQPELDFPPLDAAAARRCVARALHGVMTVKEAQGTPLKDAFHRHLAPEQLAWLDELAPLTIPWHDGRALKLLYTGIDEHGDGAPGAEAQVKLHECFPLKEHPRVCEGRAPVRLWLCAPEGKRLESTTDWPAFRTGQYPKIRRGLAEKYPGVMWV